MAVDLSLVGGVFQWSTIGVAAVLVLLSLRPWTKHRFMLAAVVAVGAFGLTVLFEWQSAAQGWIQPALPTVSYPWVWAVVFALTWAVVGWRSANWKYRSLSPVALVGTVVMTLTLFNAYFFYFPTLGSLIGGPLSNQANAGQMAQIQLAGRHRGLEKPVGVPAYVTMAKHGVTLEVSYPPTVSKFHSRAGWVYLPPAWFGPKRADLPVILLLSGTPSSPIEWMRSGYVDRFADQFAARHDGMAPVLATIDENGSLLGDTECVDRPGAMSETFVNVDVRRALIAKFGVTSNPNKWGVAGLSEGGLCAENLALRHPTEFKVFGDFGGSMTPEVKAPGGALAVLFHGDRKVATTYDPGWMLATQRYPNLHGMFVVGDQDGGRERLYHQAAAASKAGVTVKFRVVNGAHTFWVWRTAFQQFLPFAWHAMMPRDAGTGTGVVASPSSTDSPTTTTPSSPSTLHNDPSGPVPTSTPASGHIH